jgi:predicted SnoaL-like aldol condensation-catalyzing enzyme
MKILLLSLAIITAFAMCNSKSQQPASTVTIAGVKDDSVLYEKNKNIVSTAINEVVNKRNLAAFDEYFDPNVIDHAAWEGQAPGVAGLKKAVSELLATFSEIHITVDKMITAGDMVATKDSWKATHATTKKVLTGETMHMFLIKNGKITEEWSNGWQWLEGQ